jgi:hypothetical protein
MSKRLVLAALLCGLGIAPALADQPLPRIYDTATVHVPYLPVPHDAAVILDTGSTNTLGYRVVVQRNGDVEYVIGGVRNTMHADAGQTAKLFTALAAGMPLSQLQSARCMKSASFGTAMFAYWNHQRSPDLTCPAGDQAKAVYANVSRFVDALGITRRVSHPLPPNEPRRPIPEPSPSPSS